MSFIDEFNALKEQFNKVVLLTAGVDTTGQIVAQLNVLSQKDKDVISDQDFLVKVKDLEVKHSKSLLALAELNDLGIIVPSVHLVEVRPPASASTLPYVRVSNSTNDNQPTSVNPPQPQPEATGEDNTVSETSNSEPVKSDGVSADSNSGV